MKKLLFFIVLLIAIVDLLLLTQIDAFGSKWYYGLAFPVMGIYFFYGVIFKKTVQLHLVTLDLGKDDEEISPALSNLVALIGAVALVLPILLFLREILN